MRVPFPFRSRVAAGALVLCAAALILGACGGGTPATSSQNGSASQRSTTSTTGHPSGLSALNVPTKVGYGSGSIGPADPTTTLPNEVGGQAAQPDFSPGQNIIIKSNAVYPSTLEANVSYPVVWYNLTKTPQRIVFNNFKYFPVDSGTIPPGGTFTWTPPDDVSFSYTLEPSGAYGKVDENPANP